MATMNQFLQGIYISYWDRAADPAGFSYWNKQIQSIGLTGVAENFAVSEEGLENYSYFRKYEAGLEITAADREIFVDEIYQNLFAREADAEGKAYWVEVLESGESTPGAFIAHIMNASYVADGDDWATASKKIEVAEYFTTKLVETGNDWTPTMAAEFSSVMASIDKDTTEEEMAAALAEADAIIDADPVGQTLTLTEGVDNFTGENAGGAGQTTFLATHTTLTANDRMDGGGSGENVLEFGQSGNLNDAQDFGAFFSENVENYRITNDSNQAATFDMNGVEDLENIEVYNSRDDVTLRDVRSLADIKLNDITSTNILGDADIAVAYQNSLLTGDEDAVNLELTATNRVNSEIGKITLGNNTGFRNTGIETLNLAVTGYETTVDELNSRITNLNISGEEGSALTVHDVLPDSVELVEASEYAGDLNLSLWAPASGEDLVVNSGSGDDVYWVGRGANLDMDLGAGDDRLQKDARDLFVTDEIEGGEGYDQIRFVADPVDFDRTRIVMDTTEHGTVTGIEKFDVRQDHLEIRVSNRLIDAADEGTFTIQAARVENEVAIEAVDTIVDLTRLDSVKDFTFIGYEEEDGVEAVGPAHLMFTESQLNSQGTFTLGGGSVITIQDTANITAADMAGVTVDGDSPVGGQADLRVNLMSTKANQQTIQIDVSGFEDGTQYRLDASFDADTVIFYASGAIPAGLQLYDDLAPTATVELRDGVTLQEIFVDPGTDVDVVPQPDIDLTIDPVNQEIEAGDDALFTVTIENNGDEDAFDDLDMWVTNNETGETEYDFYADVEMAPGEMGTYDFTFEGLDAGEYTIQSQYNDVWSNATLTVNDTNIFHEVTVTGNDQTLDADVLRADSGKDFVKFIFETAPLASANIVINNFSDGDQIDTVYEAVDASMEIDAVGADRVDVSFGESMSPNYDQIWSVILPGQDPDMVAEVDAAADLDAEIAAIGNYFNVNDWLIAA